MRCHDISLPRFITQTTQFTSIFHNLTFKTSCRRTRSRPCSCSAFSRGRPRCILRVRHFPHEGDKEGGEREYFWWVFSCCCRRSGWGVGDCRMDRPGSMGGGDEAQKEGSRGGAPVENEINSLLLLISACWSFRLQRLMCVFRSF